MLRFSMCALLILSFNSLASAQDASALPSVIAPPPAATLQATEVPKLVPDVMVLEKASLRPVARALVDSNLSEVDAEIEIDYAASGDVIAVRLVKTSTVDEIDKAILAWAGKLKLKPGLAGTGRIPFKLKVD